MIRSLIFSPVLLFATIPFASPAATTTAELRSLLARPLASMQSAQTLRGQFVQTKQLSGFPQLLISNGDFLYLSKTGIVWRTLAPIQSEFLLDGEGMRTRGTGASANASGPAAMKPVAAVFIALFGLDLDALARLFELSASPDGEGWHLNLVPRDPAMAAVTPLIALSGSEQIEHIEFADALGDRTEIRFSGVQAGREAPTADERARLAR